MLIISNGGVSKGNTFVRCTLISSLVSLTQLLNKKEKKATSQYRENTLDLKSGDHSANCRFTPKESCDLGREVLTRFELCVLNFRIRIILVYYSPRLFS